MLAPSCRWASASPVSAFKSPTVMTPHSVTNDPTLALAAMQLQLWKEIPEQIVGSRSMCICSFGSCCQNASTEVHTGSQLLKPTPGVCFEPESELGLEVESQARRRSRFGLCLCLDRHGCVCTEAARP